MSYIRYFPTEQLHVRYDNGEEEVVDVKRVEPEGFTPPLPVISVCCQCKGGKYSATIVDVLDNKVMYIMCKYLHFTCIHVSFVA